MSTPQDPFAPPPGGQQPFQPAPGLPPYGAPGYAAPYGTPVVAVRNGLGTAALVLGIVSIPAFFTVFGGVVFGLLGIIFGVIGRGRARRGQATNGGSALTGIITGAVGLVLALALLAVGIGFLTTGTGKKLRDCIEGANGDRAAIAACQTQFRDDLVR